MTISTIPFHQLKEGQLNQMEGLFVSSYPSGQGGLSVGADPIFGLIREGITCHLGRVFISERNGLIKGYALCLDNLDFKGPARYPAHLFMGILPDNANFLKNLAFFHKFSFIQIVVVSASSQREGVGTGLLRKINSFYEEKGIVLLGSLVGEKNWGILNWLNQFEYLFIDYFPSGPDGALWFRVAKIFNQSKFFESINPSLLPHTFNTIIPIQLNLATQNINKLLKRLNQGPRNSTRIIWSSFFQYGFPILSKNFGMRHTYNGYYKTLLDVDKEKYPLVVDVLRKVIKYQIKKDFGQAAKVASVSPILRVSGFEMFIINDNPGHHSFPAFPDPVVFDVRSFSAADLIDSPYFKIGSRWSYRQEYKEWKRIAEAAFSSGKGGTARQEWEKWLRSKRAAPEEAEALERMAPKRLQNYNGEEKEFLREILLRRRISDVENANWEEYTRLHRELFEADKTCMEKGQLWCHAIIPMSFSSGGVSGLMFSFIAEAGERQEDKEQLINDLAYTISNAFAKNMFNIILKLQDISMRRYLMKFAIATVMARNLAHNLGSHVLAKITQKDNLDLFINLDDEELGRSIIAHFNQYLRTRMDFLADISTSEPLGSVARRLDADIIQKFKEARVITNFISGSQVDQVNIIFENLAYPGQDLIVQIPHGELGNHAFYIILENIIRNICKHEHHLLQSNTLNLVIKARSFQSKTKRERGYLITIHDTIKRKHKELRSLVQTINEKYIDSSLIEDKHRIRKLAWGIAEMKIASIYLRKKNPSEYIDIFLEPNFLRAVTLPSDEPRYSYMGYELYLKKPREAIIIGGEGLEELPESIRARWVNRGIKLLSPEMAFQDTPSVTHSHPIVVNLSGEPRPAIEQAKKFPLRWVKLEAEREKWINLLKEDTNQGILWLWENWIDGYLQRKGMARASDYQLFFRMRPSEEDRLIKQAPPERLILYDAHGDALKSGLIADPSRLAYYEAGFTPSPSRTLVEQLSALPGYEQARFRLEFLEAASTKVLLVDERIQSDINEGKASRLGGHYSRIEELAWMNIYAPPLERTNLAKGNFSQREKDGLTEWLAERLSSERIDFVALHQGIIEKFRLSPGEFYDKYIRSFDGRPEMVVISGRGEAFDLPPNLLFLNYSNLAMYAVEEKSKYHFCQLLFSARTLINQHESTTDPGIHHL